MFENKPQLQTIDPLKICFNVGALLDIPTGNYVKGIHGENILNGGLGVLTGIAGRPNSFKSTIIHYMILSAASKVNSSGNNTYISTYDTEINMQYNRLYNFTQQFDIFKNNDIIDEGVWSITDKTKHSGNEWYKEIKNFLKNDKLKNKKYITKLPIVDKHNKQLEMIFPTFGEIDSISEFNVDSIDDIQDKTELGDSAGNTLHMRLGLAKTRLMMELPPLCNSASHYMALTAHLGDEQLIAQGPYNTPTKKMQHLKQGDKIKGITDKFLFLTNAFWVVIHSTTLNNSTTKTEEYPKFRDNIGSNVDLNIVTLKLIRNKNGQSGSIVNIIISQNEGVLPSLTEFHYIKENDRYGLSGNNINYRLDLYPNINLTRTTIRSLLDSDYKLRRAVKITSDLLQLSKTDYANSIKIPKPIELYEKLKEKYDWDILLNTRDWWTFNNDEVMPPFLSTFDLIEMFYDKYKPYWLKS